MKKIFRKKMKRLIPVYAVLTTFALLIAASCASSENGSGDEPVIPSANTLVASFYLQKDDSVMAMLDSVKFTVDVDKQLIYNADSLPKGTKINRLLASLEKYAFRDMLTGAYNRHFFERKKEIITNNV